MKTSCPSQFVIFCNNGTDGRKVKLIIRDLTRKILYLAGPALHQGLIETITKPKTCHKQNIIWRQVSNIICITIYSPCWQILSLPSVLDQVILQISTSHKTRNKNLLRTLLINVMSFSNFCNNTFMYDVHLPFVLESAEIF